MKFDEIKAIKFIQNEIGINIDDDEILNIIDIIWDFYEDNGLLDFSIDNLENDIDVSLLIKHVQATIKKDKLAKIDIDLVEKIVLAELQYENSLDDF